MNRGYVIGVWCGPGEYYEVSVVKRLTQGQFVSHFLIFLTVFGSYPAYLCFKVSLKKFQFSFCGSELSVTCDERLRRKVECGRL